MIIPYKAEVSIREMPISNYLVIIAVALIFVLQKFSFPSNLRPFVLAGWSASGLLGHMWLHAGYFHIIINLIFLWVFGNAVCANVGNIAYPYVYIGLGLIAGAEYLFWDNHPAIGASGAIFGIMGMYVILYPYNSIRCLLLFIPYIRRFSVAGVWVIGWWFLLNLFGALTGFTSVTKVAYLIHVGGFLSGVVLAVILLKFRLAQKASDEEWLRNLWS